VSTSPPSTTLNVALAQVDCVLGDVTENTRRARDAIARARAGGADLVVFRS
jgi:predicted amidohydrolase